MTEEKVVIKFKKTRKEAQLPKADKFGDAGLDLFSAEQVQIPAGQLKVISTGIELADVNSDASIDIEFKTRSSMGKKQIIVLGGICDMNYRGELKVILHNASDEPYMVEVGHKIAQAVVHRVYLQGINLVVEETDTKTETLRGENGFGSTGA